MKRHFLRIAAIGHPFKHAIEPEHFTMISLAFGRLKEVVRIEEQWDAVIQNYLDLERNLLDVAARTMVVQEFDLQVFSDLRLRFAVRLSNLLSTCKAYLDQTPQRLRALNSSSVNVAIFKTLTSAEYDRRFGYRFMEALRGHAQHHGLPLHGATYGRSRIEATGSSLIRYAIATHVHLNELRDNPKFKKSVLKELRGDRIASEPHIRDYIEGLSAVHDALRSELQDDVARWLQTIKDAVEHYKTVSSATSTVGLAAFELDDHKQPLCEIPLSTGLVERIESLQRRNRHLVNLGRRFVTSAVV